MAFEVAQAYIDMLKADLPASLEIKDFYISERSLQHVQSYPIVAALVPQFEVERWYPDGYLDIEYRMIIAAIVLEQQPEILRAKLYDLMNEIIFACIKAHNNPAFPYTMQQRNFRGTFGAIFTSNTEQFIADAQLDFRVYRTIAEGMSNGST